MRSRSRSTIRAPAEKGLQSERVFEGTSRFQIVRRLGVGGMGAVFEVFDRERQLAVALKVLAATQADALMRFKREFRSLQSVHHPNLAALGELFSQGDMWFFTMELVRGVDLLSYVRADAREPSQRRRAGFDEARLRASFHQLGLGVAALHRQGQLHRDIKPQNVMVTTENRVVLLDFGLVRDTVPAGETSPDIVVGTPEYMAPEQAAGGELTPAADWYAVGSLLYEALTGRPPFDGPAVKVMVEKQMVDPPRPSKLDPHVPDDLESLCMALMRREAHERPGEAEILARLYVELRRDDRTYLTLPRHPSGEQLVGRHEALATLHASVAAAAAGELQLAFVTGGWGIGKTALVRELARQLAAADPAPRVWSSRCHERESIPFKAVDMLMDDAARYLTRLSPDEAATLLPPDTELIARTFPMFQRVPALASLPAADYDAVDLEERRTRLLTAVRELFRRVAQTRPLVLLVEDLQWADADGVALLREIVRAPHDAAITFVGTMRSEQPFVYSPAGLLDGTDAARVTTLHLDPLAEAEMIDLIDVLAPDADEAQARRVVQQAGGHPLFARELCLARDASRFRLDDALKARIEPLPETTRALLDVLAVAETALPQELLAEIGGLHWPEAERAIAHLRAAQLATTVGLRRTDLVEIAHERVRQAARALLLPPTVKAQHKRIAQALERSARASAEVVAAHWVGAGERTHALDLLLGGAAHAIDALAFDRADALFDAAAALAHGEERERVAGARAAGQRLRNLRGEASEGS
ncbi:MAG: Serine/threonine-protein kinase PknA [Myxococcales bacterium]|nr:Serine/threonine-protein kinase PknA [Myxococcales bacterium]